MISVTWTWLLVPEGLVRIFGKRLVSWNFKNIAISFMVFFSFLHCVWLHERADLQVFLIKWTHSFFCCCSINKILCTVIKICGKNIQHLWKILIILLIRDRDDEHLKCHENRSTTTKTLNQQINRFIKPLLIYLDSLFSSVVQNGNEW